MKATNETKADFADAIAAIRAAADQNPEYPGKIKDIQRGKPEDRAVFRIPAPHSKGVIVSCEPWRQCINALADKLEKNARFFGGVRPTLKVSKVGDARGLTAARSAHAEGHHRAAARALGDRLIFTVRAERNPTFQPYCKSATCEVSGVEYSIGFAVFGKRKTMLVIHEPTGMFISARSIGNPRTEAEAIAAMQSDDHAGQMALIADALAAGKHPDFDQASELAEYLEADTLETLSPEPIAEPEAAEAAVTEGEHSAESFGYLEEMPCAPFQAPRRPAIEGYPTETCAQESAAAAAPAESAKPAAPNPPRSPKPVTPQVASASMLASFIGIAADSVDRLRASDVDRVIRETPAHYRLYLAGYIKANRYELSAAVDEAMDESEPSAAQAPSETDQDQDGDCATIAAPVVAQAAAGSIISATLGRIATTPASATEVLAAQPVQTKARARWNGSTWIHDSPPDDGGNSPTNAGMPTDEAGEGAGEDSPLESITIMRAEGYIDCPVLPAGETRTFHSFESAAKGLRDICGSMRPSHMTREAYARFISDEHNRNWLQSLRDELSGCAFPLPLPDDCAPAPYGDRHEFKQCGIKYSVRTNHMCLSM